MSSGKDPRSVVEIVLTAWDQLQAGNLEDSLALLASVDALCDRYSTYYVVLGSALLTNPDHLSALRAAERALELTPGSPHAGLIAEISRERMATNTVPHPATASAAQQPKWTLAALLDPIPEATAEVGPQSQQFDMDKTADELTRERPLVRPIPEPEHIQSVHLPEPEGAPALVSETLADIMIRQGKLTDAKKVYIQLARLQPERYAHFKTKIEAIDKLLLGTSIAPDTAERSSATSETTDNDPVA